MAILSKVGIASGSLIQAAQITQIIDALTASGSVIDILVTGSVNVEGPTRLGTLGENSQSPLIFNPDTSGESVFYAKNPSGTLTIGTGDNPYLGGDLITLSPLGALGVAGNLTVSNNTIVNGNLGVGTTIPQAKFVVSNNNSQSIYMDYSVGLNANYIESFNTATQTPLDMIYYMAAGATGSHRFYTNGSQKMVINRDGRVGIGTTTPTVPLNVNGETIITGSTTLFNNEGTLNLRGTNSTLVLLYPDNSTRRAYFGFSPSLTGTIILENEYLTGSRNIALVTNGGFVGINKYVPTVALDVAGGIEASTTIASPAMNTTHLTASNANISNAIIGNIIAGNITANNTYTTNFSSSGNVIIGTPGVSSTSHIQLWPQDASGNAYYINDSASIFNIGNGVFSGGSGTNMISVGGSFGVAIRKTFTNGSAALDVNGNTIITGSLSVSSIISGSNISLINSTGTSSIQFSGLARLQSTQGSIGVSDILTLTSDKFVINSSDATSGEGLKVIGNAFGSNKIISQGGQPSFALRNELGSEKWVIFKSISDDNLGFFNDAVRLVLQTGGTLRAGVTAAQELGTSSIRWNNIYLNNNPNVSSDSRIKTNITGSSLGLNFINSLNPVQYTFLTGSNEVEIIKTKDSKRKEITIENVIHKPGIRTHFGLIAQEVKAALPENIDFAGWCLSDKNDLSSQQSLRYEQLISPMIKAIQEQQTQIEELKLQVATLLSGSIN